MGYRSQVLLAHVFKDTEHRAEVMAVYAMNDKVQQYDILKEWEYVDTCKYPMVQYVADSVKWYESYEDVQAITGLSDIITEFCERRELPAASCYLRVGEDTTDIEEEHLNHVMGADSNELSDTGDDMLDQLYDCFSISRSINY